MISERRRRAARGGGGAAGSDIARGPSPSLFPVRGWCLLWLGVQTRFCVLYLLRRMFFHHLRLRGGKRFHGALIVVVITLLRSTQGFEVPVRSRLPSTWARRPSSG